MGLNDSFRERLSQETQTNDRGEDTGCSSHLDHFETISVQKIVYIFFFNSRVLSAPYFKLYFYDDFGFYKNWTIVTVTFFL